MKKQVIWSFKKFILMIYKILNNKFDCVIIIEGNRGLGKSTLAFHIAKAIHRLMWKRGKEGYRFNPRQCLLYKREEVIRFFNRWKKTGIADEMINVTFNRDFYNEDQKDLIKMMNMNRDHYNLFIACVPQFQNLDSQIKGLCKIRLTVVRRGVALIQTQNRTIYGKDRWDQALNEKIERKWIEKGVKNPVYARLTTFRGYFKFSPLSEKHEELYQRIKNEKRHQIAVEKGYEEKEEEDDPIRKTTKLLLEGRIRNSIYLQGIAVGFDIPVETFRRKIRMELKKQGKEHNLSSWFWEKEENVTINKEQKDKGGVAKILSMIREKKSKNL